MLGDILFKPCIDSNIPIDSELNEIFKDLSDELEIDLTAMTYEGPNLVLEYHDRIKDI